MVIENKWMTSLMGCAEYGYISYQLYKNYEHLCVHRINGSIPVFVRYVRVDNLVFEYPKFIEIYGLENNNPRMDEHAYRYFEGGILSRIFTRSFFFRIHRMIEVPLIKFRHRYATSRFHRRLLVYNIMGFLLGLNCGFGMKSMQHAIWQTRHEGRPVSLMHYTEFMKRQDLPDTVREDLEKWDRTERMKRYYPEILSRLREDENLDFKDDFPEAYSVIYGEPVLDQKSLNYIV